MEVWSIVLGAIGLVIAALVLRDYRRRASWFSWVLLDRDVAPVGYWVAMTVHSIAAAWCLAAAGYLSLR